MVNVSPSDAIIMVILRLNILMVILNNTDEFVNDHPKHTNDDILAEVHLSDRLLLS